MEDTTSVPIGGEMSRMLGVLINRIQPRRILETGTFHGTGTTRIVIDALKAAEIVDCEFVTIECNPDHFQTACANLNGEHVAIERALSVPRARLPELRSVQRDTVDQLPDAVRFADHDPADRATKYVAETDYPDIPDDAIGYHLRRWNGQVDLVILDSAGHVGKVEFDYLLGYLRSDCMIVLDDTRHCKHARTLEAARKDRRISVVVENSERYGFAILEFTAERAAKRLLPRLRQLV